MWIRCELFLWSKVHPSRTININQIRKLYSTVVKALDKDATWQAKYLPSVLSYTSGNRFNQDDRISSMQKWGHFLSACEIWNQGPNSKSVELGVSVHLRSLWSKALPLWESYLFSLWILYWSCGLRNSRWKEVPCTYSVCPYLSTHYLFEKYSCLALQILALLAGVSV